MVAEQNASDATEPIIVVRDLAKRYGAQEVVAALDLVVFRKEILAVVGASGSGKSVLLRLIIGLEASDKGNIEIFGTPVNAMFSKERRIIDRRIGVLFQQGALFSSLSVLENVAFPIIEHAGLRRPDAERLARAKLAFVGLPMDAINKPTASLSGGMIKRVALARALSLDPALLFLDEPTAGLDPIAAAEFDQLILTLRDALGLTVFLVTHDLDSLYQICDRVAVMSKKSILAVGTFDAVSSNSDPWIHEYFHGPRGRAAEKSASRNR
jgi:phospholipid/cholesterol/gamma-HCH transport system ATP-binding protein